MADALIGGTRQYPTHVVYTGKDLHSTSGSRVAQNEDLYPGSVMQIDLDNHGSQVEGYEAGVPTYGKSGAICVVDPQISRFNLDQLNALEGVTANLRVGGKTPIQMLGRTRARVKANIVKGVTPLEAVDGQMYLAESLAAAAASGGLLYSNVAPSAVTGTLDTEQFLDKDYTIPANTLRPGDVIEIDASMTVVNSNATDTLTGKLYFGSQLLNTLAAVDAANSDVAVVYAKVIIRTATTAYAILHTQVDVDAEGDPVIARTVASFTIDTTAATLIRMSATWSVAHADNDARLDALIVRLGRAASAGVIGPGNGVVAIAAQTVDNSAVTDGALQLADVWLLGAGGPF